MKLVSPVAWYVLFWTTGAIVFLVAARLLLVNPLVQALTAILAELRRWP